MQRGSTLKLRVKPRRCRPRSGASQTIHYLQPNVLVIDDVGCFSYGLDRANGQYHIGKEREHRSRPLAVTAEKLQLTAWGDVLHDHDLAVIVDRTLENGRLLLLDSPAYRLIFLLKDSGNL